MKVKNLKKFKKIVILLIIVIQIFFCLSGRVEAKDANKGGKLLSPVADLLVFTGDSFMDIGGIVSMEAKKAGVLRELRRKKFWSLLFRQA